MTIVPFVMHLLLRCIEQGGQFMQLLRSVNLIYMRFALNDFLSGLKEPYAGNAGSAHGENSIGIFERDAANGEYRNFYLRSDFAQRIHADSSFARRIKNWTEHNEVGMRAFGIDRFLQSVCRDAEDFYQRPNRGWGQTI